MTTKPGPLENKTAATDEPYVWQNDPVAFRRSQELQDELSTPEEDREDIILALKIFVVLVAIGYVVYRLCKL